MVGSLVDMIYMIKAYFNKLLGKTGKQAALVIVGDAITASAGIFSAMILARLIPVEVMGTYRQVLYITQMFVSVTEFGISTSIYRFWNLKQQEDQDLLIKMLIISSLIIGLMSSGIIYFSANLFSVWYKNIELGSALMISATIPLSSISVMLIRPTLICKGFSLKATSIETIFALINVISIAVPLIIGYDLNVALAVWALFSFLRLFILFFVFRSSIFKKGKWVNLKYAKEIWEYLWPIQLSRFPGYITGYLDKVVMSVFSTTRNFAIYSLGAREVPFLGAVGYSVSNVLIPRLVCDVQDGNLDKICEKWSKACISTAVLTYLPSAFCIIYSEPVIRLLFSETYIEGSIPFRIFASLAFLRVVEYASLAKAFGRSEIILRSAAVSAVVMVILSIPFAITMGSFGMASAVLLSNLSAAIYFLLKYKTILKRSIKDFFPWDKLFLIGIISFISCLFASFFLESTLKLYTEIRLLELIWKMAVAFAFSTLIYSLFFLFLYLIKTTRDKNRTIKTPTF